jgi:hypothetical protein
LVTQDIGNSLRSIPVEAPPRDWRDAADQQRTCRDFPGDSAAEYLWVHKTGVRKSREPNRAAGHNRQRPRRLRNGGDASGSPIQIWKKFRKTGKILCNLMTDIMVALA